ncbi:hypothetical protein BDC45DRAFT_521709 [Circinella umbellata]|nr:hypothetical protein BDC45DRAFT_521709 [Circinella umbellata]
MSSKTICHACKKRQRGCFWTTQTAKICVRCTKLNLKCIPFEQVTNDHNDDDVLPKEFAVKAIDYWRHQIEQLENDMQQLENDTQCLATENRHKEDNNSYHDNRINVTRQNFSNNESKKIVQTRRNVMSSLGQQISPQQKQEYEWKLTVQDGLLRLHNKFESIQELLQYSDAFMAHLSPFRGVFQKSLIHLETMSFNLLLRTFRFVFLSIEDSESNKRSRSSLSSRFHKTNNAFNNQHLHNPQRQQHHQEQSYINNTIKHPTIPCLHMHYQPIIDHLIHIYSNHENSRRLFLHVPTFLKHHHNLQDPLSCPITLAVCVHILCTTRQMITHSAAERRAIANFFYDKCKDILFDMFDDPKRKLETIVVINLLQHFTTFILLRVNESRRWTTVAHQLCKDLESSFEQRIYRQQEEVTWLQPGMERVLLQRHAFYTKNNFQLLDFIMDESKHVQYSAKLDMTVSYMEVMPGEDIRTCEMIEAHNRLLQLCTNPYMAAITTHSQKLDGSSKNAEVSFDILMRLNNAIRDWWNDLPVFLRLCDDPYAENAMDAIEKNTSVPKALIFSFIHSILLKIDACVLDVVNLSSCGMEDYDDDAKESSISYDEKILLYNRAKSNAKIRSCELLLSTVIGIVSSKRDVFSFLFEFLSRVMYTMLTISYYLSDYFSSDLREKFAECFDAIRNVFPSDNIVPASISPLNKYVQTLQMTGVDVYQNYSLPGYAVLADMVNACHSYVKLDYRISLQEPLYTYLNIYTSAPLYGNFCFLE